MKFGILGAGGMANVHARHLSQMPDTHLLVWDPDPYKQSEFMRTYSAQGADSEEGLIGSADAVDICVPTDLHFSLAMKAIEAEKPTFVEKPAARTVAEGKMLLEAATKLKTSVAVGHVVRFFPEFRAAHEMVAAGKVGTVASVRLHRGGRMPGGGVGWFTDHRRSGGVLVDLAIHDFDFLCWTLGKVSHVYCRSVGASTMEGPDYALATVSFESGAVAHVESTWMDPSGFRATFEISGSQGLLEYDSRQTAIVKTTTNERTIAESPLASSDDPYFQQLHTFIRSVESGSEPPVSLRDGVRALAVAEAAVKSAKTNELVAPVAVD